MPKGKKGKPYKAQPLPPPSPIVSHEDPDQEEVVPPEDADQEEGEESLRQDESYSEGSVRRHNRLFIDSGDFFLQAEKAIFKIHRHFLIAHSPVWRAMLSSLQDDETGSIEAKPWVLDNIDKSIPWELLLSSFYRQNPLVAVAHTGEESLHVLELACKYEMEIFKTTILSRLQKASGREDFIDLLVAARMVESEPLRYMAIQGLIASRGGISSEEAERIGLEEYYGLWNSEAGPIISCTSCGLSTHLACHEYPPGYRYYRSHDCSWE